MRRSWRRPAPGGVAAALPALLLTVLTAACVPAAAASPHIVVRTPHPYQVVQRGAGDRADLAVEGFVVGQATAVRVRWGDLPWTTVRCARDGAFRCRLERLPAGQAALTVQSVADHSLETSVAAVGVGDIYVVAGQSNASGRSPTLFSSTDPTLRAAEFGNDYRWAELRDPVDSPRDQVDAVSRDTEAGGSVWPLVAGELMGRQHVPVAFVPCARAATTIRAWQRRVYDPRSPGSLYGSMLRRIAAVGGRVRAVLFWQGEADARKRTPAVVYERLLRRFAADVRRDCGAPVVAAQIGDYDDNYADAAVNAVRLAQLRSWGHGVRRGPTLYDIDLEGQVHFLMPDDVWAAARRWTAAVMSVVFHRPVAHSPRLVSASYDGRLAVTLVLRAPGAPLAGGPVDGIVLRSRGREVPVAAAAVTAPQKVTLTLAKAVRAPLTVSLGGGRTAAGAAVPVESSDWRLPTLMFLRAPVTTRRP